MSYLDVLSQREGWGDETTGGKDGAIYRVTTLADSGPGSLRYGAEASEPLWIVFDVSGKIATQSAIYVKSHKTIDGRGKSIALSGNNPLRVYDADNIILLNFTIDPENHNWKLDGEGGDGVTLYNANFIWVHHCRFQHCFDGCIDAIGSVNRMTVSRSRIFYTRQAVALRGDHFTLAHCYVYQVFARFPKAIAGRVHSYNNVINEWGHYGIQAVKENGQLLAEHNIYYPGVNVFDDKVAVKDVNRVESTGGRINCHSGTNYQITPTTFVGGKDTIDASWAADSWVRAKIVKASDSASIKKLLDITRSKAGPTLPAVSYDEPAPTPEPGTIEERVADLELRVEALEA